MKQQAWYQGAVGSLSNGVFLPLMAVSDASATESSEQDIAPDAFTLTYLELHINAAPTPGNSRTFTVRINGADTAVVITIADGATSGSWTGSLAVAAHDLLSVRHNLTGTPAACCGARRSRRTYEFDGA